MKTFHKLTIAGVAMACVSLASAQTYVRITGSTAYRQATTLAIMHMLGGTDTTLPASGAQAGRFGYVGASLTGGKAATFIGSVNGNSVIIKTSWSGAVGGVQTVAGALPVKFLPESVNASLTNTGVSGLADPTAGANPNENVAPQVAMADNYQSSTVFNGTFLGVTYASLVDNVVGVVPFKFVASPAAPGLSGSLNSSNLNVTPQLAQATWKGLGKCPLALYTGNSGDQGTFVFATGRDPDSGTRLTAFAESGIGVNSTVRQFDTATNALYTQQTVNGIVFPTGQGGESSGGTLATKMFNANATTRIYLTYFSTSDAATAIAGGAKECTYNGVAYSAALLQQGKYTFWGYEHLMYRSSLTGVALSTATSLADQITNTDATVLLSSMSVVRGSDGGLVTADY